MKFCSQLKNSVAKPLSAIALASMALLGSASVQAQTKTLYIGMNGGTMEKTYPSGTRVNDIRLDHATVQYLYNDGDLYYFMDTETNEQPAISVKMLGETVNFLVDNTMLELETWEGEPISIELPTTVDMEVIQTDPGFAGDTATNATKPATVSTGYIAHVPLFVTTGDVIRVDTRTGEYLTRVSAG